jgi:hypothetical protein
VSIPLFQSGNSGTPPAQVTTTSLGRWSTVPIGLSPGTVGTNQAISAVANRVYAVQIVIPFVLKVTKISVAVGATNPNAVADFGFYDINGNLLTNTGGLNCNAASTVFTATIGSPVTLQPGVYYFAWCGNFTSGGFNSWTLASILNGALFQASSPAMMVHGSNAATSGVLPPTLGTLTADNFTAAVPFAIVTP